MSKHLFPPLADSENEHDIPSSCSDQKKRLAVATPETAGNRLDKWLSQVFPDVSRTRIQALIDTQQISLDGIIVQDPSLRVKVGQTALMTIPTPRPALPAAQDIPLTIVYEDEHVIVLDKPAGLVVHPAAGHHEETLVNALLFHCKESLSGIGGVKRPGIVHRIDKDTSGLLVVAKNDLAHITLAEQFSTKSAERAYQALVWGAPTPSAGEINGNIGRSPANRQKMAVLKRGGKTALTRYRTLEHLLGGTVSLIECRLATGRTHQIRVHMTHIGHTLVGDPLYGSSNRPKAQRSLPEPYFTALTIFPRQALHAYILGFTHPVTGQHLYFESPLPKDFTSLLGLLRSSS